MAVTESITRLRATPTGETDRYGNPTYEETPTTIPGAHFAPGGSEELNETGREALTTAPKLYWRNEWPDILPTDRIIARGTTYTVEGDAKEWRGSVVGGLVVQLHAVREGQV